MKALKINPIGRILLPFILSVFLYTLGSEGKLLAQVAANYDEQKVGKLLVPDPLITFSGEKITDTSAWKKWRRPEILALFENLVYGRVPGNPDTVIFQITDKGSLALHGKALRKQIQIVFKKDGTGPVLSLLVYLPVKREKSVPVFLGLNFDGNQSIANDPGVPISSSWYPNDSALGITNNRANEKTRGTESSRWNVEYVVSKGYGIATMYYGDIDPDFDDGFQNGVHPLFYSNGKNYPAANEWGSIAAWAWGLSRAMDYLCSDPDIDAKHIAVLGHSRLGKTALWAGALDIRFRVVISNNSGCGGAALSKRIFGETLQTINTTFPHWFCDNFQAFNQKEGMLPVDQHLLISLMAPRPVYVTSATEDLWADPKGEFLGAFLANPVYHLFGKNGLPVTEMPPADTPVMGSIGYHLRTGRHDITLYDWEQFIKFAEMHK